MTPDVKAVDLGLAAALLLVNVGLSRAFRLGLGGRIVVAALRCVLQLAAMGLVLHVVFDAATWWKVLPILLVMVALASQAAISRVEQRPAWLARVSFLALLAATTIVTAVAMLCIFHEERWYEPRLIIPMVGMLLGNALTGMSLGMRELIVDAERRRDLIELRLRFGATGWRALQSPVRSALATGMIPVLNSMAVAGVVSIPGMMTGQLLAGQDVGLAVRYQILIFFLITATTALGLGAGVLLAARRMVDRLHRLTSRTGPSGAG